MIVENLPAARDQRVRRECRALLDAGYGVSVICPRSTDPVVPGELRGVVLREYPAPPEASSTIGYVYEYLYSWLAAAVLTVWAAAREGFDCIQACNPPDTYFALALPFKLAGKPFVFDHHDLAPELYTARFGKERGPVPLLLRALERATFATADHVVSTNESFRRVARTRGHKADGAVTIVRNGPPLDRLRRRPQRPELRHGRQFLACWVGIMGAVDDGVDIALRAIDHFVHVLGRQDCHFTFLGDGEAFDDMRELARRLGITEFVTFTGWVNQERVFEYLSTSDLALQPDPKSPRTDVSSATKTVEYMGLGVPVVAFDLDETRVVAADAAAFATDNDPVSFAGLMAELLDDPETRAAMGAAGRARVRDELAWDHQKDRYVAVFDGLLGAGSR